MGLMDRMMDRMIINLSVTEKEELMMQMMPAMMEEVQISSIVPIMLEEVGSAITLSGAYNLLRTALNDGELKQESGEVVDALKEKLPDLAEMMKDMMPLMLSIMKNSGIMDRMMNLMANLMPVMMPMMRDMAPTMMNERMPKLMARHENVNELMPAMMIEIMPNCLDMIAPEIEQEERAVFLSRLADATERASRVAA